FGRARHNAGESGRGGSETGLGTQCGGVRCSRTRVSCACHPAARDSQPPPRLADRDVAWSGTCAAGAVHRVTPLDHTIAMADKPGPEPAKTPDQSREGPARKMTVVGIGASAGGLDALKQFFSVMPADTGLAFVVVVHLAPQRESHLAELLQPRAKMPVQQVTDTAELKPNRVYVIPPGRNLSAVDNHLSVPQM